MSKKSKSTEEGSIDSVEKQKKDKSHKKEAKEKKKDKKDAPPAAPKSLFAAPAKGVDEGLASLFSINAGPVKIVATHSTRSRRTAAAAEDDLPDDEDSEEEVAEEVVHALAARDELLRNDRKKKRKRTTEPEVEDVYMEKLLDEEPEAKNKKPKKEAQKDIEKDVQDKEDDSEKEDEEMADASDGEDEDDDQAEAEEDESEASDEDEEESEEEPQERIRHETEGALQEEELDKAKRTVFIGNLPSSVISDKSHHIALKTAFKAYGIISSVRFRSIAFSDQIPRKAAFITKAFHVDQTTVNAYIVFKTAEAARASLKLNGTVLLNHHIRVDSVAHPAKNDSRRCVFVGNLDFEAAEESLWKHFGTCGKVENVRLVRDAKTNVGKGFAYVQFVDEVDVEKALLLNEKPMEVEKGKKRKLRVTRARNMRRKAAPGTAPGAARSAKKNGVYVPKADPRKAGATGRAGKLFGRAGGAKMRKIEETGTFEGMRAVPGMDVGLRTGGTGKKKDKPRARKTARSAAWKSKTSK
ncbi:Nucleolar protein 12 [Orbilia ellipsospora]|uniref:Nucleolar protein 12 n=1 Tax=Orbilia ellipsospora TaxID=2528407 RepID=A0AAV9XHG4_9PEZI